MGMLGYWNTGILGISSLEFSVSSLESPHPPDELKQKFRNSEDISTSNYFLNLNMSINVLSSLPEFASKYKIRRPFRPKSTTL